MDSDQRATPELTLPTISSETSALVPGQPPANQTETESRVHVWLTRELIDEDALEALVAHPGAGAICTFQGVVRDHHAGKAVDYLVYEAYEPMAEAALAALGTAVLERWPDVRLAIAHRLGRLRVGEASVIIAVSSPHRAEAFEACRFTIDTLKTTVPIWKHEFGPDGASWVEGEPLAVPPTS